MSRRSSGWQIASSRCVSVAEDVVNLGPEGRMIKVSELPRGLLTFGGLYCDLVARS